MCCYCMSIYWRVARGIFTFSHIGRAWSDAKCKYWILFSFFRFVFSGHNLTFFFFCPRQTCISSTTHSICRPVLGAFNWLCKAKLSHAHHRLCAISTWRNDEILLKNKRCRRIATEFSTTIFSFTWHFENICCLDANRFLHFINFVFHFFFCFWAD